MKKKYLKLEDTKGKLKPYDPLVDPVAQQVGDYYDKLVLDVFNNGTSLFYTGKFRKKKVIKYFKIKIPIIERHYYCSEDYADLPDGWLITFKEINLFPIGTEIIKVPVARKFNKDKTIKFKRYSKLK